MKNIYSEILENEAIKAMLNRDQIEEVKRLEMEEYKEEMEG